MSQDRTLPAAGPPRTHTAIIQPGDTGGGTRLQLPSPFPLPGQQVAAARAEVEKRAGVSGGRWKCATPGLDVPAPGQAVTWMYMTPGGDWTGWSVFWMLTAE
jgi:hypothetical protein